MQRIAKLFGLSLVMCAWPWAAQPADTATFRVGLTISESCLVRSSDATSAVALRPQVSCLHDAPHLTRLMTEPASTQTAAPVITRQTPTLWLVMF